MRVSTHFRIACKTLFRIKRTTNLIIVLLALGIASLYSQIYLGQAAEQETARRFYSQGYDLFSIIKKRDSGPLGPKQFRQLDFDFIKFLKHSPKQVMAVAPEMMVIRQVFFGEQEFSAPVIGVMEEYLTVHGLELDEGRFFTPFDSAAHYCVLGNQLANRLKSASRPPILGGKLYLGNLLVENIGVLRQSSSFISDFSIDDAVLIPLRTLQQFSGQTAIEKVTVRANPSASVTEVVDYLKKNLQLFLGDDSIYEVTNQSLFLREISKTQQNYSLAFGVSGIIFLIAAAWAMVKSICLIILRRKNELTFVQEHHMKDKVLLFQFLIESTLPGLVGGLVGIALGILLSYFVALFNDWLFFVSRVGWIISLATSVAIGLAMGWYPSVVSMYSKKLGRNLRSAIES